MSVEMEPDGRPLKNARLARYKKPERSAVGACTKYTLFFENFILVIVGATMTTLGAYILVQKDKTIRDPIDFFLDPACDLCLAGSIVCFMGFLGSYGALREHTCFLKTYHILLCLILLTEIVLAILMFVAYYVPEFKQDLFPSSSFQKAIENYRNDPDMKNLIDTMQKDLQCCGLSNDDQGFMDWNQNMYFNCSTLNNSPEKCSVPYSCCRDEEGTAVNYMCGTKMFINQNGEVKPNTLNTFRIYTDGCTKALGDWIDSHSLIVGGVMLGVLLPQVFVVVLTRNLISMITVQKSKW